MVFACLRVLWFVRLLSPQFPNRFFHNKGLRVLHLAVVNFGAIRSFCFFERDYDDAQTTTLGGLVDGPRSAGGYLANHFR